MIEKFIQVWFTILPFPTPGVSRGFASSEGGPMCMNDSTDRCVEKRLVGNSLLELQNTHHSHVRDIIFTSQSLTASYQLEAHPRQRARESTPSIRGPHQRHHRRFTIESRSYPRETRRDAPRPLAPRSRHPVSATNPRITSAALTTWPAISLSQNATDPRIRRATQKGDPEPRGRDARAARKRAWQQAAAAACIGATRKYERSGTAGPASRAARFALRPSRERRKGRGGRRPCLESFDRRAVEELRVVPGAVRRRRRIGCRW